MTTVEAPEDTTVQVDVLSEVNAKIAMMIWRPLEKPQNLDRNILASEFDEVKGSEEVSAFYCLRALENKGFVIKNGPTYSRGYNTCFTLEHSLEFMGILLEAGVVYDLNTLELPEIPSLMPIAPPAPAAAPLVPPAPPVQDKKKDAEIPELPRYSKDKIGLILNIWPDLDYEEERKIDAQKTVASLGYSNTTQMWKILGLIVKEGTIKKGSEPGYYLKRNPNFTTSHLQHPPVVIQGISFLRDTQYNLDQLLGQQISFKDEVAVQHKEEPVAATEAVIEATEVEPAEEQLVIQMNFPKSEAEAEVVAVEETLEVIPLAEEAVVQPEAVVEQPIEVEEIQMTDKVLQPEIKAPITTIAARGNTTAVLANSSQVNIEICQREIEKREKRIEELRKESAEATVDILDLKVIGLPMEELIVDKENLITCNDVLIHNLGIEIVRLTTAIGVLSRMK